MTCRTPSVVALAFLASATIAQSLPPVPEPPENPSTPAKVILGKILFFEEQAGRDNTTSCATCHMPEVGGGDPRTMTPLNVHPGFDGIFGTIDDARGSRGVVRCDQNGNYADDGVFFPNPQVTRRKASPAIGAGWDPVTFWDGRAGPSFIDPVSQQVVIPVGGALEAQAALPPTSGEMGCQGTSLAAVATKLQQARPMRLASNLPSDIQAAITQNPTYPMLFNAAFGDPAVTPVRFSMAIAAYERTLVPDQTPWDAFVAGQTAALTPSQQHGLSLFTTNCTACHVAPLFTDHGFHNVGVRPPAEDTGREEVTQNPLDRGKFKVPGLRNVGLRRPYFHNGGVTSLLDVVLFYNRGGDFSENRDPLIQPLNLTWNEVLHLVDFLEHGLTDPRVSAALPPFDRPALFSEQAQNPQPIGTRTPGTGGFFPQMLAPSPPMIGADRFGLGLAHARGGSLAFLAVSAAAAAPGANLLGVPLSVHLDASTLVIPASTVGSPGAPGAGYTSFISIIADDPGLNGITLYAQWAILDPGATAGFSATDGVQFTFTRP